MKFLAIAASAAAIRLSQTSNEAHPTAADVFNYLDANGDGKITAQEART